MDLEDINEIIDNEEYRITKNNLTGSYFIEIIEDTNPFETVTIILHLLDKKYSIVWTTYEEEKKVTSCEEFDLPKWLSDKIKKKLIVRTLKK